MLPIHSEGVLKDVLAADAEQNLVCHAILACFFLLNCVRENLCPYSEVVYPRDVLKGLRAQQLDYLVKWHSFCLLGHILLDYPKIGREELESRVTTYKTTQCIPKIVQEKFAELLALLLALIRVVCNLIQYGSCKGQLI